MGTAIVLWEEPPDSHSQNQGGQGSQAGREAEKDLRLKVAFEQSNQVGNQAPRNAAQHIGETYCKASTSLRHDIDDRSKKVRDKSPFEKAITQRREFDHRQRTSLSDTVEERARQNQACQENVEPPSGRLSHEVISQ